MKQFIHFTDLIAKVSTCAVNVHYNENELMRMERLMALNCQ